VSRSVQKWRVGSSIETDGPLELTGPSVHLRDLLPSDAPRVLELLQHPEVSQFFLWDPPGDLAEAEQYVQGFQHEVDWGCAYHFAVVGRAASQLLGVANLYHIDRRAREAEIGIWLGREYWGRGIQPEVSGLLLRLGFETLKLRRIIFQVSLENARAQAAFQKLGATERGRAMLFSHRHAHRVEHLVYELKAAQWRGKQPAISEPRPLSTPRTG
jgi:RimJ/RimL family protein N-acetyltransferase